MAGGAGSTVHLQVGGAGSIGQLGGLGLGCEVQGLGGLLRETQRPEAETPPHGGARGDTWPQTERQTYPEQTRARQERKRQREQVKGSTGPRPPHPRHRQGRQPRAGVRGGTCRGWWAATAPGLFTTGAGGLCSNCRGYSATEKAARRKVLDEHRTADALLDEVPAAAGGQRPEAGPACFQPRPSPAPECCWRPPMPSSPPCPAH